jgi:hypothetical protein
MSLVSIHAISVGMDGKQEALTKDFGGGILRQHQVEEASIRLREGIIRVGGSNIHGQRVSLQIKKWKGL